MEGRNIASLHELVHIKHYMLCLLCCNFSVKFHSSYTGQVHRMVNDDIRGGACEEAKLSLTNRMTLEQMKAELLDRESKMQAGGTNGQTDQWRVYQYIIGSIIRGEYLRLMIQASAGTGKSFLLTSVFLWCIINNKKTKAAAPTGIAAANIEIEGTDVCANTIHTMLDLV